MVALHSRRNKPALLAAGASVLLYAAAGAGLDGPADTLLWLAAYAAAWAIYLGALLRTGAADFVASPWVVLGWSLLARLVLCPSEPWLSDDLWRYLLDGRVLLSGANPFALPPEHPLVQELAPAIAARVNHPEIPTIYPPLVQVVAAGAAALGLLADGWRVLVSLVDLGVVVAVARLFGGGDRGWRAAAVYGWCPLAVWEAGANGHLEPLVLLPLVLAVHAIRRGRGWRAGLALGLAVLAKYFPLLLIPALARERNWWKMSLLATIVVALGLLPFAWGGVDIFAGMRAYLGHWSFNSPLYEGLAWLGGGARWPRVLPFLFVLVAGFVAALRGEEPLRLLPLLLFAFLVTGPTLHPWYALWVLPWLGDRPHEGLWAFVGAMGGAYAVWWQVHRSGEWALPPGVGELLWSLVALGWAIALWRDGGDRPGLADTAGP